MTYARTDYGVDLRVQLGIGRQLDRGVWDSGRWDVDVWGQADTALGDWVDVTCDVEDPFTLAAGASDNDGIVTRWEAATLKLTLWGDVYNPWQGPYAGIVGPGVRVRVQWREHRDADDEIGWISAFTGQVSANGWDWNPVARGADRVEISASDLTQNLAAYPLVKADSPVGEGDSASARVTRLLDLAHWPADKRDVQPGGVPLQGDDLEGVVWEQLLDVADTDLALLWVDRDGVLSFVPEGRVGYGMDLRARLVVCADPNSATAVQVVTLGGTQYGDVRNDVSISRFKPAGATSDPAVAHLVESASAERFSRRAYSRTDLLHRDDSWSASIAQVVLLSSAWPTAAPRSADLDSRMGNPYVPALLLGLEPVMTFDVEDNTGRVWREECTGWNVRVGVSHIAGTIALNDVSRWIGSTWDADGWDRAIWGIGALT